ncbi:phage portal protein [Limibaculum sp. FT325]|uniref:phage portal protein n=1 Tax=Thermohalobaculum sediminis TaxID=2939436 RepID=UPI0020C02521|nr:phage portal protein [Limibaculum sediminis]MCL5775592.1 phage portal protein [Limibaculum sediminis]
MGWRLFRASAGRAREEKASAAAGPMMAFHGPGRAVWSPRDMVSLTRNGFEGNVIAFRAVRMVAEAAAALPLVLAEGGARMVEHPVLGLLARPNPAQDGRSFLECVYGYLQLAGNAYVEAAEPGEDGHPRELHCLRPDRMAVVPGPDGWPAAYDYSVGRAKHRFDNSGAWKPILHVRAFHPLDDHYGMSPLEPAAASIDVHNAASRWSRALLDNAARPSGAIVFGGKDGAQMSDEQYQRLVRELEDNHQGARNAGRPLLLEGGLDWRPMGYSPQDMEFLETKHAAARDIALAFGVPPMLLGLPGDNTYANFQEANRAFYRQTVLPLAKKVACALAVWLGDNAGARLMLEPDLDAIPALAAEREALWRRIAAAPFLTDDEKRAALGFAPRDGA